MLKTFGRMMTHSETKEEGRKIYMDRCYFYYNMIVLINDLPI
jgi:hypothetical protein